MFHPSWGLIRLLSNNNASTLMFPLGGHAMQKIVDVHALFHMQLAHQMMEITGGYFEMIALA
jgi:hypothetical protein